MSSLFQAILLLLLFICFNSSQSAIITSFSSANSSWSPSQNLTLVSPKNTFAAGFYPSDSKDTFIFAIWVKSSKDQTVVWSLDGTLDTSSALTISASGEVSLNDTSGKNIWLNDTTGVSNNSVLTLEEDGSLTIGSWRSSDHPTDTIISNHNFSVSIVLKNKKFVFNGSNLMFNQVSYWSTSTIQNFTADGTLQGGGQAFISADKGLDVLRRLTLDTDGNLRIYSLHNRGWRIVWQAVMELCTITGTCGLNAICMPVGSDATRCICPPGYKNFSNSCQLKIHDLSVSKFLRLDFVNVGNNITSSHKLTPIDLKICQSSCLTNTTCIGFSYNFKGGRDCTIFLNQFDFGYWSPGTESAMFIKVANSETDVSNFTAMTTMIDTVCPVRISLPIPPSDYQKIVRNVAIISTLFILELLAGILSFWAFLRKYSKYRDMARTFGLEYMPAGGPKRFSYDELKAATNNFSNPIGHGGFGVVYKGELSDHRVIAVKRLKNIGGGEAEFWAEVSIIARMHHLNLVRLWGFCAEKEQRMLVYEYVPNGSLDKYLFQPFAEGTTSDDNTDDPTEKLIPPRPLLDWNIRYRIAIGVARAIAYLHEECLEWVLHCDIKPENILLEDDFCPKVSDFGLSKLTNKKDKVTMSRMRGTRGYMAPEWVIHREPITAKADVYSFGMVLLEMVSGTRNSNFHRQSLQSEDWYMPKWAFEKVYLDKKIEDILDRRIMVSYDSRVHLEMVDRMVKTAMWCLQDKADMRPSMGKVAKMLEGTVEITEPLKPTIFCFPETAGRSPAQESEDVVPITNE